MPASLFHVQKEIISRPSFAANNAIGLQANKYALLGASHALDRQLTGAAGRRQIQLIKNASAAASRESKASALTACFLSKIKKPCPDIGLQHLSKYYPQAYKRFLGRTHCFLWKISALRQNRA